MKAGVLYLRATELQALRLLGASREEMSRMVELARAGSPTEVCLTNHNPSGWRDGSVVKIQAVQTAPTPHSAHLSCILELSSDSRVVLLSQFSVSLTGRRLVASGLSHKGHSVLTELGPVYPDLPCPALPIGL